MEFNKEILFFLSLLGSFNGAILAIYFLFFSRKQRKASIFLGALLLVLSVRIGKSVFFHFNDDLANSFIHIGIMACSLIGPLLLLYTLNALRPNRGIKWYDVLHLIPVIIVVIVAVQRPYHEHRKIWAYMIRSIYWIWLFYEIIAGYYLKDTFKQLFSKKHKLTDEAILLLSVYIGTFIICIAYLTSRYTSYIVGALSFTFIFYILGLMIFARARARNRHSKAIKSNKNPIDGDLEQKLTTDIALLMNEEKIYKDSNLKMPQLAKMLHITPHQLSQFINNNLGQNFSQFLNEYRIQEAETLLLSSNEITIDAMAYECGFNSTSSFYTAFKKIHGVTPATFRKQRT